MKTTNTYGASLIEVMGSDLTVVNAARVSFDKESRLECPVIGQEEYFDYHKREDCTRNVYGPAQLKEADRRLIAYLARNGHWTPFAHPQLSFRVSAPIFVARQLQKHQIGLAWNEVSRRYVDSEPVVYVPTEWRLKADNVKQGSSDELYEGPLKSDTCNQTPRTAMSAAITMYRVMLERGICPEQARMVLPQSMLTEWVWTGSLAAFARVCKQRLDAHAQRECRPVAEAIAKALEEHFPVSWEALKGDVVEPAIAA